MSCTLALAAALLLAEPVSAAEVPSRPAAVLTAEPLYADIVARARALEAQTSAWRSPERRGAAAAPPLPGWSDFRARAAALAELDMAAHRDLAARGVDGDLKCILKGVAEDLPRKLDRVETSATGAEQDSALNELAHLLDDNAAVVLAPPAR